MSSINTSSRQQTLMQPPTTSSMAAGRACHQMSTTTGKQLTMGSSTCHLATSTLPKHHLGSRLAALQLSTPPSQCSAHSSRSSTRQERQRPQVMKEHKRASKLGRHRETQLRRQVKIRRLQRSKPMGVRPLMGVQVHDSCLLH
jgi:hypothetical protein